MAGSRSPIQIKDIKSGEVVKIQVVSRLANEIFVQPGFIEFQAPRFPKLISKSNGVIATIESETRALDRIAGATNKTVTRFRFITNRQNTVRDLSLQVSNAESIKVGGLVRINANTALPIGLRVLDDRVLEVKNIVRNARGNPIQVQVNVPQNINFSSGFGASVTSASNISITPYQKNDPGFVYSVQVNDNGIMNNLEYHDDYRTVIIFAYERRSQNSVPANKIMVDTGITLSASAPPAYSSLPAVYGCFATPRRVVQSLAKKDDVAKTLFHAAIAKYYKNRDDEWIGEWLQKDGDGRAIWKTVEPKPK